MLKIGSLASKMLIVNETITDQGFNVLTGTWVRPKESVALYEGFSLKFNCFCRQSSNYWRLSYSC